MTTNKSNPAFAFVVNSLLNSNKNAKLLSKAKKESEITFDSDNKKAVQKIEIVNDEGIVIEEVENTTEVNNNNIKHDTQNKDKVRRIDVERIGKVKPNLLERNYERKLNAVATKGVVQLFNVVKEQQKGISKKLNEVGTSGEKRAKALSEFTEDKFIEKVNSKKLKFDPTTALKKEDNKKKSFLSENFMAGDKFKNWDIESDEEDDNNI